MTGCSLLHLLGGCLLINMRCLQLLTLALLVVQVVYGDSSSPEVTLSHGGSLVGRSISYQGVDVDLFQGIRFAKPPTGNLRFKKTERYPPWEGRVEATSSGNRCPQIEQEKVVGDEDCLFMDITVPGGVTPEAKKAVMVWIHGGGYMFGTGSVFLGTPLAVTGDVIYVSFNYRIAILGFLADGPGTGNFGLWDQRAAIVWVKENIAQFGGDPELITIFGESAGAGSVSSQVMGQHNDGLFKRAIQQSGTLYQMLPTSVNRWCKLTKSIRQQTGCTSPGKVYDCLADKTAAQLLTEIQVAPWESFWHPFADNDFFGDDVLQYSYERSQRFDLLMGMNGEEGGIMLAIDVGIYAMVTNRTLENGMDLSFAREYLTFGCPYWFAPFSAQLCADFVINNYGLDKTDDDRVRLLKVRDFLGQAFFDADIANQLSQHGDGLRATYAYYFTEPTTKANSLWKLPEWAKSMADHADELSFVFGGAFYEDINDPTWKELVSSDPFLQSLLVDGAREEDKPLSKAMMIMWSNFAKTGNPNKPVPLPEGTPTWPQFDKESNQWMEINSNSIQVVTTPDKDLLEKIQSHIYSARALQFAADRPSPEDEIRWMKAVEELRSAEDATREHDEL